MTEADVLERLDVPSLDDALPCESIVYVYEDGGDWKSHEPCPREATWRLVTRCCGIRPRLLCEEHRASTLALGLLCKVCRQEISDCAVWTRL